ncbi:DUF1998 domain-containing protein [Microcella flavibacter]|uniref:DUF1998 domain-containing protein n=1 Tax=Microcella flavibacter TaxID=1804990 RepID=UPI0014576AD1|nr:DUF1998 domain-containing protein [Microcella flavibacter]
MNDVKQRSIRLSETVSPFGPGAIVDIVGESFMAVTGDHWPPVAQRQEIPCDRLASKLRVDRLWGAPPHKEDGRGRSGGLEFVRFPSWLVCQECQAMTRWRRSREKGTRPLCEECEGRLVPIRFVVVCTERSHVGDVPWVKWVHASAPGECSSTDRLRFRSSRGRAEGLSALEVVCEACGTSRSLGELRRDILLREGQTCWGAQPWESGSPGCGKPIDVQQRGATSLHFGETVSAIDIPEVEGRALEIEDAVRRHPFFGALLARPDTDLEVQLVSQMSAALKCPAATVREVVAEARGDAPPLRATRGSLLAEEFEAFLAASRDAAPTVDFETRRAPLPDDGGPVASGLRSLVDSVVLVDRVREVRASYGFSRYRPDAELVPSVPASDLESKWLPAVEGWGEGIFLKLGGAAVDAWASSPAVTARFAPVVEAQAASVLGGRLHEASPEYVLLHTLAHVLMAELAFRSGYSAPSLRERIYCEGEGDYGVFIYTTSSDVEGTLGGLVRQGETAHLANAVVRAVEQAAWCANDPVCSESEPQSIDGLNLAACHACVLSPETSCESSNLLLDRLTLVGGEGAPGYFQTLLSTMLEQSTGG